MNSKCCNQAPCKVTHPLPTQALFACGQGTGVTLPIPTAANPTFNPITISSVTLDASALCNPSVKIDFNSLISYQSILAAAGTAITPFTVTFQLNKVSNCGTKIALGSWDYSYGSLALATNLTNSFGFSYCECNICPGCYVYTIEVVRVAGSIVTGTTITETASIRSSSISATAVSH